MLQTVKAKYKNGIIELSEAPRVNGDADVLVTFLESNDAPVENRILRFGALTTGKFSTEVDFLSAEWRGDEADQNK